MTRPESPLPLLYCSIRAGQGLLEACWIGLSCPPARARCRALTLSAWPVASLAAVVPIGPGVPTPEWRPSVFRLYGYFGPTMLQLGSVVDKPTPEATVVPFISQT